MADTLVNMPGTLMDPDRRAVVEAADALFYQRGYGAVGMDAVRDAAGISLRRLYTHFPSKQRLIIAVLELRHETWVSGIRARVDAAPAGTPRLLAIFDYLEHCADARDYRGCGFINAVGELAEAHPEVLEVARAHKRSFQEYVAGLVEQAGADPALGAALALLAEGAQTTAAIAGSVQPVHDARAAAGILIDAAIAGR